MKTLYVSDLDGTLFNKKKELTAYTADTINKLIKTGGLFSVATARMSYGCDYKLTALNINIPIIVMNGVCLYSLQEKKYVDVKFVDGQQAKEVQKILDSFDCNAFVYSYHEKALSIDYKIGDEESDFSQYLSARAQETCREIRKTERLSDMGRSENVIYFALTGQEELIRKIHLEVSKLPGIGSSFYLNIYNGYYCLEIFNEFASKEKSLLQLAELVQAERLVVFGDNHNDLGMMRMADESYAPEDAVDEAKLIATEIIGSHNEDGVAEFIEQKIFGGK